jgi:hypothetical protein
MDNELIYVYCLSDTPLRLDDISKQESLKCLVFQGFYAVVKYVSPSEFSEENLKKNLNDLLWVDINAREHIRMIGEVMQNSTVIPFKFGTLFNSEESLAKFIQDYSGSLTENLNYIKGKEEWSVKIYCNRSTLILQIGDISENVDTLQKEILESTPGKAFFLKRKKIELVDKEIQNVMQICGQTCYDELAALSEQTKINNILSKELTERTDDMILNVSCFVNQGRVKELLNVVDELLKKYKNVGFDMAVTGPWPPFSFILIKEK